MLEKIEHIIDVHQHIFPDFYVKTLKDLGIPNVGGVPWPKWSEKLAVKMMDKKGIAKGYMSYSMPGVYFKNEQFSRELARKCNEYMAEAIRTYPTRFGGFAVLPLPDVEGALKEMEYALDTLKLDGIGLLSNVNGIYPGTDAYRELFAELKHALDTLQLDGVCIFPIAGEHQLDNEVYLPLLQELDRRQALVLLHPINADGMPVENERYLDAVLAFTRFLYYDRFKECSNIRFMLAHTAGIIPYLADNMGILQYMQAEKRKMGKFMWDYLIKKRLDGDILMKSMYIDTADCFEDPSFQAQHSFFGAGHLLWGSDSSDAPKNLDILKKHSGVFQQTDLDLFS